MTRGAAGVMGTLDLGDLQLIRETLEMALIDDPYNEWLLAIDEALDRLPYPTECRGCGQRTGRLELLCPRCSSGGHRTRVNSQ